MLWVLGEAWEVGELTEWSLACERGELEIATERDWREGWLAEEAQFLEGACCGDDVATERNEGWGEVRDGEAEVVGDEGLGKARWSSALETGAKVTGVGGFRRPVGLGAWFASTMIHLTRVVEAHSGGDGDGLAIPGSIEVSFTGCAEVGGIGSIEHFSRDTAMVEDYEVILEGEEGAFKESGGEVLLSKGARELHVK
ncbi:hypothetical protein CYMTET_20239 [Cymbomonas tetramitiformis]|uniref:Uncharacterized protein n=1 Tax=Cymbomonas tetramitiformis TaxID=36881 RepID=A0AAE0G4L5_9CHLO|nr:hypothetical protein CYMTET_20239 [Cymbomonas tetramitiformis]